MPVTEDDKIRVTIHKKSSVKVEESGISSERADELREILEEQREFMQQKVTSLDEKVIALRKIVPDSQRSTTSNRRQEHEFMEH